jgi:hypothetical protein
MGKGQLKIIKFFLYKVSGKFCIKQHKMKIIITGLITAEIS